MGFDVSIVVDAIALWVVGMLTILMAEAYAAAVAQGWRWLKGAIFS